MPVAVAIGFDETVDSVLLTCKRT